MGPIIIDPAQREELAAEYQLELLTKVAQSFFDDGRWDMAFHEMAIDLTAGSAAILMNSSSDPEKLWDPMSVPMDQLIWEQGCQWRNKRDILGSKYVAARAL
ncbi:MAG: hypothetical protein U5K75_08590 [Ahrensia sp.]|nr:hypothetical protein [Ahrensia sp.]